jgi:hypothetical protein
MLMYKFVTLLSSLATTSQVVTIVGASTLINYIILLVKYKFFASIKNRIIFYKLIRHGVATVDDTVP